MCDGALFLLWTSHRLVALFGNNRLFRLDTDGNSASSIFRKRAPMHMAGKESILWHGQRTLSAPICIPLRMHRISIRFHRAMGQAILVMNIAARGASFGPARGLCQPRCAYRFECTGSQSSHIEPWAKPFWSGISQARGTSFGPARGVLLGARLGQV